MFGMIKKDMFMIKNNLKSIMATLIIFIFYTIMFDMNITFFLPFMTLMICISTFSYDDFNNWHSYASILPSGKVNVVKSKYITTIIFIIVMVFISLLLSICISSFRGSINLDEILSTVIGELFAIVFIMSILFPVLFKYGAEKGRIVMLMVGISIMGIILFITNSIKISVSNSLIVFLDLYFPIIFFIVAILLISISYFISKRIYLKKEF